MYSCNIQQVNRGLDLLDEHFQIVVLKIGWKFPEPVIGESIIFLEFIKKRYISSVGISFVSERDPTVGRLLKISRPFVSIPELIILSTWQSVIRRRISSVSIWRWLLGKFPNKIRKHCE